MFENAPVIALPEFSYDPDSDITTVLRPFVSIIETFEKCSISFKFKEGDNFNHMNALSILRIKI